MKRTAFLICFCFLVFTPLSALHAQTYALDQSSLLLGGNASLTSTGTGDSDRTSSFVLNPSAQYFIAPGLAVGGDVLLEYTSSDDFSTTRYGIGPTASYFFGSGERSYYPFLSGSVRAVHTNFDGPSDGATVMTYRGSGGILIMLSRSIGVTGELFYQMQDREEFEVNTFGLAFGISAFVF